MILIETPSAMDIRYSPLDQYPLECRSWNSSVEVSTQLKSFSGSEGPESKHEALTAPEFFS
jgi:hypothetical protein